MADNQLSDELQSTVETFMAAWLSDNRIPGAAIAVVDGTDVLYADGFGARTLDENTPATPDTLFGIGSCTKSFTATAIMQLVEAGDIALADPVDDYLPHLADAPGDPITVEELLTHTSGMPDDGQASPLVSRAVGEGHIEVPLSGDADFRRHVEESTDRRVVDRDEFFYYNSGYTMLGKIVETVTGQSFATYVDDRILSPLGMERSTFHREDFENDQDRMTPYLKQEDTTIQSEFPFDPLLHPTGGLISSVRELGAFIRMFIEDGAIGDRRILSADSVAAMTEPVGSFGTYYDGQEVGYGYGLIIEDYLGDRVVGHGGTITVSHAWFGYLEEAELGVALACTTRPEVHIWRTGMAVLALLQGEQPEVVHPHYRLKAALESATGDYDSYREIGRATVERVGGGLKLRLISAGGGGQELLLTPKSVESERLICTTTQVSGLVREVRFEFTDEGVDLFVTLPHGIRLSKSE